MRYMIRAVALVLAVLATASCTFRPKTVDDPRAPSHSTRITEAIPRDMSRNTDEPITDAVAPVSPPETVETVTTEKEPLPQEPSPEIFKPLEQLLQDPPISDANIAFCYEDITTGYRYSYNGDTKMWAASVMKLPYALSILYKTEKEDVGINDTFVYTGDEYVEGTGVIKNMPIGSEFSFVDLIELSIKHSDSIAQSQLRKKYGTDMYYGYVRSIGAETFTEEWGWAMTANHGAVMLRSAWEYLEGDHKYSALLKNAMLNTEHRVMLSPGLSGKDFARKYGWDKDGYNDVGIVYDDHPYILVFLSDMISGDWTVNGYISEIARTADGIHEEIWGTNEDAAAYTVSKDM